MGNKRLKISIKTIILIISLIIFSCMSVITFAWFTDKESYSGTLDFGTIELDVSGTGIDNTNKTLKFDVTRTNGTYTAGGKVMPGDTVNIPIKVSLTSESESAYYLIFLSDPKGIFESGAYFSDDGTNVYVSDGTKIYNQKTKATVTDKIVGKLSKGTTGHDITISATISTDFEEQNATTQINCTVCAIQQANLEESTAKQKLNEEFGMDLLKVSTRTKVDEWNYDLSSNGTKRIFDGTKYYVGLTSNNYWGQNNVTVSKLDDTEITITATYSGYGLGFDVLCKAGEQYCILFDTDENGCVFLGNYSADGTPINDGKQIKSGQNFTVAENVTAFTIIFRTPNDNLSTTFTNFRLVKIY